MKIERARLRDTPALAWTAAQAFAAGSAKAGIRRRARGLYLMHLYSLTLLACGGRLWHWEKKAIIAIEHKKPPARGRWLADIGACVAVVSGLLAWISTADGQGLQLLLAIMKTGGAFLVIVLVLLLPAMYPQTMEGLTFATTAIEHVIPSGAALYTEARSDSHRTIYARRGFRQLATTDGMPTMAMGAR